MIRCILVFLLFPCLLQAQSAFIAGNDTICDNDQDLATVSVSFTGDSPFSFIFTINGVPQPSVITTINPYIINTKEPGNYTLISYNDANSSGSFSGSGLVTVLESPTAIIHLQSDTLLITYPVANFISESTGNIISWDWNFGDNTLNNTSSNISHVYKDSSAIYHASLIVIDENGCSDTSMYNIWVTNEVWIYIPSSFSPNYDMVNDKFCIEYNGVRENTFLFKVFNSQGSLIFQSTNVLDLKCSNGGGWNGQYLLDDIDLPSEVYIYEIYFQDFDGWKHKEYGMVNLIR